jgi:hypothetical protein
LAPAPKVGRAPREDGNLVGLEAKPQPIKKETARTGAERAKLSHLEEALAAQRA